MNVALFAASFKYCVITVQICSLVTLRIDLRNACLKAGTLPQRNL